MELVKTTPEKAASILKTGNRQIKLGDGRLVCWINLNNNTCFAQRALYGGCTVNNEDVEFYICVPQNAKTVY